MVWYVKRVRFEPVQDPKQPWEFGTRGGAIVSAELKLRAGFRPAESGGVGGWRAG